jgi:hypothetical protein
MMSWRKLEEWSLRLARATKFARRVAANPVGMRLSAAVTLTPVSYGCDKAISDIYDDAGGSIALTRLSDAEHGLSGTVTVVRKPG